MPKKTDNEVMFIIGVMMIIVFGNALDTMLHYTPNKDYNIAMNKVAELACPTMQYVTPSLKVTPIKNAVVPIISESNEECYILSRTSKVSYMNSTALINGYYYEEGVCYLQMDVLVRELVKANYTTGYYNSTSEKVTCQRLVGQGCNNIEECKSDFTIEEMLR